MKVALVLAGNIWFSPYVRIYTRLLELNSVKYSIISWNRDGNDEAEGFQFNERVHKSYKSASFKEYYRYIRFVKKTIHRERFDRLIIFGSQIACLLSAYLVRWKGKFIIDYRDLSIEQYFGLRQLFAYVTGLSYANVISSPGFKRCLPKRDYYISHNFDVDMVRLALSTSKEDKFNQKKGIDILTIGGIRDFSSNIEIVKSLANKNGFTCRFVGRGDASSQIEDYCKAHDIYNVQFSGYYKKEEEPSFLKSSTFLNIFYPRVITHDTAMSNRFYNSLLFKRPMIVTKNTTQGDYAEQYGLGVVLDNCNNLSEKLIAFTKNDFDEYAKRCNKLLNVFLEDQKQFEEKVISFLHDNK